MKSLGEILAKASAAEPAAKPRPMRPEPRPHRVRIAYMVFADMIVVAKGGRDASTQAMAQPKQARRKFRTTPYVYRIEEHQGLDAAGQPVWKDVPCA